MPPWAVVAIGMPTVGRPKSHEDTKKPRKKRSMRVEIANREPVERV